MSNMLCIHLFGKKICFPLYYVDPWRRRPGPDPEPRLQIEGIENEVIQDVERLASMREIAQGLTHNQARPVIAVLDAGLATINKELPKGYQVEVEVGN